MLEKYFIHLRTKEGRLPGTTLSPNTILSYATSIRAFLRFLHKANHAPVNFSEVLTKPTPGGKRRMPFTKQEITALLVEASTTRNALRDRALLLFLLDTGARLGDAASVLIDDVHFDRSYALFRDGKGRQDREVPFGPETAMALRRYIAKRRKAKGAPTLFQTEEGAKLSDQGMYHVIGRLGDAAGIRNCHPHRFRHTMAYTYVRNGGNVLSLKLILGHKELKTTERYVALMIEDLVDEHRAFSPVASMLR